MDRIDVHKQVPRVEYHKLQLTARAYHRVLKLSRMMADLPRSEVNIHAHLVEVRS